MISINAISRKYDLLNHNRKFISHKHVNKVNGILKTKIQIMPGMHSDSLFTEIWQSIFFSH